MNFRKTHPKRESEGELKHTPKDRERVRRESEEDNPTFAGIRPTHRSCRRRLLQTHSPISLPSTLPPSDPPTDLASTASRLNPPWPSLTNDPLWLGLYTVRSGRFLWSFLHRTEIFGFLKIEAVAAPEDRFSSNIGGGSNRLGCQFPPVYHTHKEEEISKTKIKSRKLKDSNHKSKLRSNLNIKIFKNPYRPKY